MNGLQGKIKVLLVEDEAIVAKYLQMELELEGYDVYRFVTRGEDAIISAREDNPDLVLMDINLLGTIDGIDAAAQILENKPDMKLIFMTGYPRLEYTKRAEKLNPLGYLNKPVEVETLRPLIQKAFNSIDLR
jgi:YesN/AraC family two-component response regulator